MSAESLEDKEDVGRDGEGGSRVRSSHDKSGSTSTSPSHGHISSSESEGSSKDASHDEDEFGVNSDDASKQQSGEECEVEEKHSYDVQNGSTTESKSSGLVTNNTCALTNVQLQQIHHQQDQQHKMEQDQVEVKLEPKGEVGMEMEDKDDHSKGTGSVGLKLLIASNSYQQQQGDAMCDDGNESPRWLGLWKSLRPETITC